MITHSTEGAASTTPFDALADEVSGFVEKRPQPRLVS
jgi:hypothetical protein